MVAQGAEGAVEHAVQFGVLIDTGVDDGGRKVEPGCLVPTDALAE